MKTHLKWTWIIFALLFANISWAGRAAMTQEDLGICNPTRFSASKNDTVLSTAIASTGSGTQPDCSGNIVLHIPPGTWTISNNLTIPTRMAVNIPKGAIFSIASGKTLTLPCDKIQADDYQIFTGSGSLVCSNKGRMNPVWTGAIAGDSTDDQAAFQLALDALETNGGILWVPDGVYNFTQNRLEYNSTKGLTIECASWQAQWIWDPATDTPAQNKGFLNVHGTSDVTANHTDGFRLENCYFDFGHQRGDTHVENKRGINLYNVKNSFIVGNWLQGSLGEMVGCGNFGTAATAGTRHVVQHNVFFDWAQDASNPNCFESDISHNFFFQGSTGIEAGRGDLRIADNDFYDLQGSPIQLASIENFTVTGNVMRTVATTNLGSVNAAIQIAGGGETNPSVDGVIANNEIVNTATHANQAGIQFTTGTQTTPSSRIKVTGNNISGISQCIYIVYLSRSSITDNNCLSNGLGVTGIGLVDSADVITNIVSGNHVIGYSSADISDASTDARNNLVGWNYVTNEVAQFGTGRRAFVDQDTTPDVSRATIFTATNTVGTSITTFDGMPPGECFEIYFANANTTIVEGATIALNGTGNFTGAANDMMRLCWNGAAWLEVSRSVN